MEEDLLIGVECITDEAEKLVDHILDSKFLCLSRDGSDMGRAQVKGLCCLMDLVIISNWSCER